MSIALIKDNSRIFNKNEIVNKSNNNDFIKECKFCILSLLIETNKSKDSFNTSSSYISKLDNYNYKYDSKQKFDELNRSLSDVSDFYLEEKEDISLFNSSEEENVIEEQEIISKSKTELNHKKYYNDNDNDNDDFENEIENEFKDLLKELNIKKH
jgi:hypothetical protein